MKILNTIRNTDWTKILGIVFIVFCVSILALSFVNPLLRANAWENLEDKRQGMDILIAQDEENLKRIHIEQAYLAQQVSQKNLEEQSMSLKTQADKSSKCLVEMEICSQKLDNKPDEATKARCEAKINNGCETVLK